MSERRCKHCGVEVRQINYALGPRPGPRWMHTEYPHQTRDAYCACRSTTVAEPERAR